MESWIEESDKARPQIESIKELAKTLPGSIYAPGMVDRLVTIKTLADEAIKHLEAGNKLYAQKPPQTEETDPPRPPDQMLRD